MARRYDPERRQRIIDAAIRVVGERGIAGLSHRAVAAAADVPLGSTTYHFATLDDLLVAALRQTNTALFTDLGQRVARIAPDADLAAELADLVGELLTEQRDRSVLEYEIYLTALRRAPVRPIAAESVDGMVDVLTPRTGAATARALVALIDGLSLQVLLTGRDYDREQARAMIARLLD
ncbi:TetR/AcrR family transcriptional regulator [Streptantibioticus rubrisoli]|uniref:TetR family transcriptional regulator n=1 Tax=Streptantibioticus rubrisoli TaxID=1387313 RepID=A0ABT1PHU8_9ACTN|nr:TetR family transcriptional regulator [Streptantibioticus rubrisoli]MCQ4044930.1 TetR family transcriptional regulator [Streptantibioticus rubrisoli]